MGPSGGASSDDAAWRPPASGGSGDPGPAEELDGFTDLVEVGRGGDSVVYRATQTSLNRDVAIKVLRVDDDERVARFRREIDITVGLGRAHPNIVTVLATGITASGRPAIVMDYFEGGTLHDRLKQHGPLTAEEVSRIGAVLADALSFAHERGVLHRDVKPQNVLVLPTSWVLADFGIARLADSEHTTSVETFTYRHAAPQILDGQPPTAADDLWSLGSTLYTLLDGRPPFASDDPDEDSALAYLRRARTEPHRPLTVPGAEAVGAVIERCLAKDLDDRWSSAAELREAFAALRTSAWEPGSVVPVREATAPRPAPAHTPPPAPKHAAPPVTPQPPPVVPPTSAPAPDPIADAPVPLAISAAAHAPRTVDLDAQPTGARTDLTGTPPPDDRPPGPEAPEEEPPPRRKLPLVLGAVALVVGLVLGLIGFGLRGGGDDEPSARDETSPTGPPSFSTAPTDLPTYRGRPTPELAFVFQTLRYDGATMQLRWTDQSEGEGTFYLFRVNPQDDTFLAEFGAGSTSAELPINLPLGYACYYLVVRTVSGEFGLSNRRCYDNTVG